MTTSSVLRGDYLGQEPPGLRPEVFAPRVVSLDGHRERDVTFSRDLTELYFSRDATIMVMRRESGRWTGPETAPFSGKYQEFEAFISPDGQRLYYISRRPLSGMGEPGEWQTWFVERDGPGWGEPKRLTDRGDFYPTITRDGVMYFTGADTDLYRSRLVDGLMTEREKLGDSINTEAAEYNSFIAPDESYIAFTSEGWGPGFGGGDLFISFRNEDGSWTRAKNMGPGINSSGLDYCPSISPDGKYFFFARRKSGSEDIYWVDARIIEHLRREDLDLADTLYQTVTELGIEAAARQYEDSKSRYAKFSDFDGDLLVGLSDRLLAAGRTDEAIGILSLALELHPQLASAARRLKLAFLEDDEESFNELSGALRAKSDLKRTLEAELNLLGYEMLRLERADDALRALRLCVELFPESANAHDSYGEALMVSGDTARAIDSYERSLELEPGNTNAVEKLEQLRGQ